MEVEPINIDVSIGVSPAATLNQTPTTKVIDLTKLPPRPEKKKRAAPKARKSKKKSEIWEHFEKLSKVLENGVIEPWAKCNYCEKEYQSDSNKNGTSSLWKHLTSVKGGCTEYPYKEHIIEDKKQKTLQFQPIKNEGGSESSGNTLKAVHYSNEDLRKELAIMIVIDEMPFKTVEKEGFKRFTHALNPRFFLPSRVTVARDVMELYLNEKAKLKKLLKSQRVCLTTDTWSSIQNLNYMCLTAHWIDDEWILRKKILNLCLIGSHKEETIGKTVEACLLDWGIDKVFTLTVDNASSNDTAIAYLARKTKGWEGCILENEYMQVRCSSHVLTVASESAFSTSGRVVDSFRSSLSPTMVEALVCGQNWLKSTSKFEDIFDVLVDIEQMDDLDKEYEKRTTTISVD